MDLLQNLKLARYIKPKKARAFLARVFDAMKIETVIYDSAGKLYFAYPAKGTGQPDQEAESLARSISKTKEKEPIETSSGWWMSIIIRERFIGLIRTSGFMTDDPVIQHSQSLLITEFVSQAIDGEYKLKDMSSQLLENYEELNLLYDVSYKTSSITNLEEVKQSIVVDAVDIISAQNGLLVLEDETTGKFVIEYIYDEKMLNELGLSGDYITIESDKGVMSEVLLEGEAKIVNDTPSSLFFGGDGKSVKIDSILCAPLETTHRILGALILINKEQGDIFISGDQKLLSAMASQAAQSIENANLFRKLEYEKNIVERIIETTADGIIVASKNGDINRFNKEARKIFGMKKEDLPTKADIGSNSRLALMMRKVNDDIDKSVIFEMIVMKPGKLFISIHTNPLFDSDQQTIGLVASIRNLTEMKQTEREKREIVSLLAQKLPALSEEIVSLAIHEPRKKLKDPSQDSLKGSIIQADQLGEVAVDLDRRITRLRRFLQIIAGPLRIERVETTIENMIKETMERYPNSLTNSQVKIKIHYKNKIDLLKVDKEHFIELLDILIENVFEHAVKDQDQVTLRIEFERIGEFLYGMFADNGKGLTNYLISLLFEPTNQLVEHEELRLDEIGLGLSYAKHVIEGHGGDIVVGHNDEVAHGCLVKFKVHVGTPVPF